MLTRRHIRIKVMQSLYALTQSKDDSVDKLNSFLKLSIENTYSLYLILMSLLREINILANHQLTLDAKKYLESTSMSFPDRERFALNPFLKAITEDSSLEAALAKRKLKPWYMNNEYIRILFKEIVGSDIYDNYMRMESPGSGDHRQILVDIFREIIAPNEKLYDFLEDEKLTWLDDLPLVNTYIVKLLKRIDLPLKSHVLTPNLLKDKDDLKFAKDLLSKTISNHGLLEEEIVRKTPNWDKDRIAGIDAILLKMAIAEFLYFPSIPERVTINEYLEIAKEYSTPKSSIFINGVLDKIVREYKEEGRLKKSGRGLL